jgi:para-nitrobenzyl esterase
MKNRTNTPCFPGRTNRIAITIAMFIVLSSLLVSMSCAPRHLPKSPVFYLPSNWENNPLVWTKYGAIQGAADKDNTYSWKGIPFAEPPTGSLRFKAPIPASPWKGTLSANSFGEKPVQFFPIIGNVIGNEDCLFLNVWRPRTENRKLPVYVWIYGGGNSIGSADFVPDYYGNRLASRSNMVFVSMNYRIGVFGWLYHPALGLTGSAEDASGNYGTLDIILALKWVKENIESFGGDPDCITVAGESAGAFNVMSLIISPLAKGLIHRAVIESGRQFITSKDKALSYSNDYIADLLVRAKKAPNREDAAKLLSSMRLEEIRRFLESRSQGELMSVLKPGATGMTATPSLISDGYVLPEEGYRVFDSGNYPNKIPVVIGTNKEEVKLFLSFDNTLDYKSELYRALGKFSSLIWKVDGADSVAEHLASHEDQPPVYVYRFDWGAINADRESPEPGDWPTKLGAFHSLEIPFFLGTDTVLGSFMTGNLFTEQNKEGRIRLSQTIGEYLGNFSRSGDPNKHSSPSQEKLPEWKPWTADNRERSTIVFDVKGSDPAISFIRGVLTKEAVMAEMEKELSPEIFTEVSKRLYQIKR